MFRAVALIGPVVITVVASLFVATFGGHNRIACQYNCIGFFPRTGGNAFRIVVSHRVRYTGLSTVYQLSGVYASGITPLILTGLIAADHGGPWYACTYLAMTAAISVGATVLLKPSASET